LEPPLCVVSNWIIRVYTILVWNTISGSSNVDICCYHCLILTLIFHLKILINFFFFFFFFFFFLYFIIIIIIIIIISTTTTTTTTTTTVVVVVVVAAAAAVIYYFDTPALGRRHQSFDRITRRSIIACQDGWKRLAYTYQF